MDAHDSDVCANVVGKSLEAVRLLSNLGRGNAPDSAYVLAAYDQLTTAAYLCCIRLSLGLRRKNEQGYG